MTADRQASILVVEDEPVVAMDIAASVKKLGYSIAGTTGRGEAAIELAGRLRPDLVLMDIRLIGEVDGIEAAEAIQGAQDVPIVYLTAYSDEATLSRARVTHPLGYLLKPFDDRDLEVAIEMALERHRLESTLRDREARLSAILTAMGDAVVATDAERLVTFLNPAAERLLGIATNGARGRPVEGVLRTWADERGRDVLLRAGAATPIELSRTPLHDSAGAETGQVVVVRDVSERVRAQEERDRLEQLKTQFFANVSHDLRTPLTLILAHCDKLLAGGEDDTSERRDLQVIRRNGRLLLAYVEDLLSVSRLVANELGIRYERADVAALIRSVAVNFESLAADRGLEFVLKAPDALAADIDPDKLHRVAINLIANAFKFTPTGGRVRVALSEVEAGDVIVLEVADSGPGVPADEREHIFDRFRQGKEDGSRRFVGAGLGLAIVHDFVALHRGTVTVTDAPEGGALFRVELPRRAPEGVHVATPAAESSPRAAGNVEWPELAEPAMVEEPQRAIANGDRPLALVVEDNPEMSRLVSDSLASTCRIARAFDGKEGLEKALEHEPDLIITDLMMPILSGERMLEEIRRHAELEAVPVLVLTARADDALRARLLREGAQDYLVKPFSPAELQARASNLLAMKRARDVLQDANELGGEGVESLARQLARRKRELDTALESMRVAREHAEQASELKTRFLSLLSHELRTPLATIHLQVERLRVQQRHDPSGRQHETLEKTAISVERLRGLIDSLLHYARIEGGRLTLDIESFSVKEVATDAVEEARPEAEAKKLSIELACESPLNPLRSDPRIVRLILVNLLGNAIKFTERGKVAVSLSCEHGYHRLAVSDTGPGIAPEQRVRVFEPFQRAAPGHGARAPGVGLGLALVRELTISLRGTVSLDSEPGAGTVFTVLLPDICEEKEI